MQKLLIITASFAFLFVGIGLTAQTIYQPKEGSFEIVFPAEYEMESAEQSKTGKTIKASATYNEHTFFAAYTLHDIEMFDHENMATVSLEAFAEQLSAKIVSRKSWKVKKHKGIGAEVSVESENVKVDYYAILIGNTQYQLLVIGPEINFNKKAAKKFFKSFKLI